MVALFTLEPSPMAVSPPNRPTSKPTDAQVYFRNIFDAITSILTGMRITLKYCFSKPVTIQYPYEKIAFAPRYRGIHEFEADKCIACDNCAKAWSNTPTP